MKTWLKILGGVVALVVLLVVLAIVLVDVKRFTPQLQAAAAEKGFDLQLGGVSLSFWPSLGLQVKDVTFTPLSTPKRPLLQLESLHLQLPIKPLLQGELVVQEITLKNASVDLWQDSQGKGNWVGPVASTKADAAAPPGNADTGAGLTLRNITFDNVSVKYQGANSELVALDNIHLAIADMDFADKPFMAEFSGRLVKAPGLHAPLGFKLKQQVILTQALNDIKISQGDARVDLPGGVTLALQYGVALTGLPNNLQAKGSFATESFNARPYVTLLDIKTQNPKAFSSVAVKADFAWRDGDVSLTEGLLNLDQNPLNWQLLLPAKGLMAAQLQAEQLNLDDYLPPKAPVTATQTQVAETNDGLDGVKTLNGSIKLAFNQLRVSQRTIANFQLQAQAQAGLLQLQKIQGEIYQGQFNAEGYLRVNQARQLELTASLAGLQLEPLINELKLGDDFRLSGVIDGKINAAGEGASLAQLQKNLQADIYFNGQQMRMAPLNITEQYCKMVNLATQLRNVDNTWDAYTQMTAFSGKLQLQGQILKLIALQAAVDKLQLNATGEADLTAGTYQAHLPITLARASTSNTGELALKGCVIGSDFWVERSLPLLLCKGQFANLDPKKDCGPDRNGITDLVKDYALYKIKKGEGVNVDHLKVKADEKKTELREKLENKLGEDGAKQIEDKLKRLLRGKRDPEPTPAP